jgi:hypothetical protein
MTDEEEDRIIEDAWRPYAKHQAIMEARQALLRAYPRLADPTANLSKQEAEAAREWNAFCKAESDLPDDIHDDPEFQATWEEFKKARPEWAGRTFFNFGEEELETAFREWNEERLARFDREMFRLVPGFKDIQNVPREVLRRITIEVFRRKR